jgi:hypothetical protein
MSKLFIQEILRENLQQADKIYFKTGKLSPEHRELVLSITNGDNYTRLVADWLYHLIKIWNQKTDDSSTIKFLKDFYGYLKTYDKNVLPMAKNLEDYNAFTDERDGHILDLFSSLRNREDAIRILNELPSIAKRNLKDIIRKPESNEYAFKGLADKFKELKNSLKVLPSNEEKKQMVLNKIFASKNNLDQMIDMANHYSHAFNTRSDETSKEELIDNLEDVDADLIQNSGDILVIRVNEYEAMQHIGCTSMWCFSQPNSEGFWNDYAGLGYVFVIFDFSKEFDDATFMMTYLPDSGAVYASTNVPLEELDIDDSYQYLSEIGVDLSLLDNDYKPKEKATTSKKEVPYKDPNQLSLFEIRQRLRESLLPEAKAGKAITAYHGSPKRILKFVDEFVGGEQAADQEGPGIYFTSSFDNAGYYGEYVHTVTLTPRKLLTVTPSSNKMAGLIQKMVMMAPDWEMHAQDYDENPRIGLRNFIESTIDYNDTEKDIAQQIWIDFYRYEPVDFVRNMVKMGIDGLMIPKNDGVVHYIIYNPAIIKIQE